MHACLRRFAIYVSDTRLYHLVIGTLPYTYVCGGRKACMGKSRVQTRVEPDTKHQIDAYAEEAGVGDAEALRRLIRTGLAAEGHPVTATDGGTKPLLERIAAPFTVWIAASLGVLSVGSVTFATSLLNSGSVTLALGLLTVGVILAAAMAVAATAAALAQLALARPLRGLVLPAEEAETA